MAFDFFASPIGLLKIEADGEAVTGITAAETEETPQPSPLTDAAKAQLSEYFAGQRREFTFPMRQEGTGFMQRVFDALSRIPYGETVPYSRLAESIGCPKAARAVGQAAHRNRLLIAVPCHRLVAKNGLGGFALGGEIKRKLIVSEQLAVNSEQFIDKE